MSELQQLKEAVEQQDDVEQAVLMLSGYEYLVNSISTVYDAARSHLALFQECDCGGSGLEPDHGQGWTCDGECCPSCSGRGQVISDQILDSMEARLIRWFNAHAHRGDQGVSLQEAREFVSGLLAVAIFGGSDERN